MKTTDRPLFQDFHIEGVRHISPIDAFTALLSGEAVIIDVRESEEFDLGSIPLDNVISHPMSVIMKRMDFIPPNKMIIFACPGGVRSTKVANLFNLQRFQNVTNLDGGLTMWKTQGLPFETNISSGGCCCKPLATKKSFGCNTNEEKNNSCCETSSKEKGGCCC